MVQLLGVQWTDILLPTMLGPTSERGESILKLEIKVGMDSYSKKFLFGNPIGQPLTTHT